MNVETLFCTCGRPVRVVRLNAETLTFGHTTRSFPPHAVRLARQCVDCGATRPAGGNHPRERCAPCFAAHRRATAPDRFWAGLDRTQGEAGCWLWTGAVDKDGYGHNRPHRKAYGLRYGRPVPPLLRHTCDTPRCCNPLHLIPGTQADNIRDRDERGRTARGDRSGARLHPERMVRGERSPQAKLSEQAVAAVRELLASGVYTHREIAAQYGLARTTITAINRGQNWRHSDQRHAVRLARPAARSEHGGRQTEGSATRREDVASAGPSNPRTARGTRASSNGSAGSRDTPSRTSAAT